MVAEPLVFLNGDLVPQSTASVPVLDFGYLYGYGVFETVRCHQGVPFRLRQHLELLNQGAMRLDLPRPSGSYDLGVAVRRTVAANGLQDARVRITVSLQGEAALPVAPALKRLTVLVTAVGLTPPSSEKKAKGYRAILSTVRRNSHSPLASLKTLNYLESFLAREEARKRGADEAVMLNERGQVACAGSANLFAVVRGGLVTPPTDAGIRPGVTRQAVLELAETRLALPVREKPLTPEDLLQAEEAFLTNSILGVMPLVEIDAKPLGRGVPGAITGRVMAAYAGLVAQETKPPPP